ncbi:MAG: C69 family dipeptidase [Sphaerochaetaceae bacterium]|jgi:secernin
MCDTMVKRDSLTSSFFFAKNSDRDPGEPQLIQYVLGDEGIHEITHPEDNPPYNTLQYKTLLKAHATLPNNLKALISRPSWIWGAEMGINEKGVSIGNEAVFAKKRTERHGLLGMDILRLALHNATSASHGVEVITSLLENFGQGGNGSYTNVLKYHNSFIISDEKEAWIVETMNRSWAAKKVALVGSISNAYSLDEHYDKADALTWENKPHFAKTHQSRLHLFFTQGKYRQQKSQELLTKDKASFEIMASTLRHNEGSLGSPDRSMKSICMDSQGFVKSRTTASMVVQWHNGKPLVWLTGAPLPNYAPFFPFTLDQEMWEQAPHADINFSYRYAQNRVGITNFLTVAPALAKEKIHHLTIDTEQKVRKAIQDAPDEKLSTIAIASLADEQSFTSQLEEILVEYGADSKSLYEKPYQYYGCG